MSATSSPIALVLAIFSMGTNTGVDVAKMVVASAEAEGLVAVGDLGVAFAEDGTEVALTGAFGTVALVGGLLVDSGVTDRPLVRKSAMARRAA